MKKTFSGFDEYYQKLKTKSDKQKEEIKEKYTAKMMEHQAKNKKKPLSVSQDHNIAKLTAECEFKISEVEEAFQRSIALLVQSYDEFLTKSSPAPQFLPVTVDVFVEDKVLKMPQISLKPTDTIKELRQVIMEKFVKLGDPMLSWSKENIVCLEAGTLITSEDVPIVQYHPTPGSKVIIKGKIHCKSDAPKQCFKATFVKDSNMVMDYFGCKTCGFNWICNLVQKLATKDILWWNIFKTTNQVGPVAIVSKRELAHSITRKISKIAYFQMWGKFHFSWILGF